MAGGALGRRSLLAGAAALAGTLPVRGLAAAGRRRRVGVIGGGIIGASVAYQLARAGADVTLFERAEPAAGATRVSVAWINPQVADATYMNLRRKSIAAWHEDDRALGMNAIWDGSISWAYPDREKSLRAKAQALQATDDPPRFLTAAKIGKVAPGVRAGDHVALAYQTLRDGHVDPVHATLRYLAAAKRLGATVLYPCAVERIVTRDGQVTGVETSRGRFALDDVVSVAGTDTPGIMAMLGRRLELAHKPGLVVHTAPRPVITGKMFEASGLFEFKQYADGRFVTSLTGGPADDPAHAAILTRQPPFPTAAIRRHHGEVLIAQTARYLPAIAGAAPAQVMLGFRPYPLDNRPICGPVPGVGGAYVIVTHGGVTLAPILGRFAAQEIIGRRATPMLAPYRPERYVTIA